MGTVDRADVINGQAVLYLLEDDLTANNRFSDLIVQRDRRRTDGGDVGGVGDTDPLHLIGRIQPRRRGKPGDRSDTVNPIAGGRNSFGVKSVLASQFAPISTTEQLIPARVH